MGQRSARDGDFPLVKRAAVQNKSHRSKHVINEACYMCDGEGYVHKETKYECAICGYTSYMKGPPLDRDDVCPHAYESYSKDRDICPVCRGYGSLTSY